MAARVTTAKPAEHSDFLDLERQRGDWVQGNVDPVIDPTGRQASDFKANKIDNPMGGKIREQWDPDRVFGE